MLPGICPCSLFHEKLVSFTFFLEGWGIDQQGVQISQDLQWKQCVESAFLLSPLLPGATQSDCLLCFPTTGGLVRAHTV